MKKVSPGEKVFVDTNILLTATDTRRDHHSRALDLFRKAPQKIFTLCLSGQILREYLVVATRPLAVNGLGLGILEAAQNVERFKSVTHFLPESLAVHSQLIALFKEKKITGAKIHDLNIVATLKVAGIKHLLTLNPQDFTENNNLHIYNLEEITTI